MKCPRCQQENEPGALFCKHCGAPLIDAPVPIILLRKEVQSLKEQVALINERLAVVEQKQGIEPITPKPAPAPPVASPVTAVPEKAIASAPAPLVSQVPPAPPRAAPPPKSREWEQILGGSWLARIGVLALIVGAGFFLKFAFDQNWLGPTARVLLGLVAGLIMLGAGYYWRKRYPTFSQALSGGGVAVLYLSIFAAFAFFRMLNVYLAVLLLFATSAVSAILALRQNSMALAIIGILGAFIAPFILQAFGPSGTGAAVTGNGLQLLVYIIVVDLGVIALSTFRNWRWFVLLAFFGSVLSYGLWYAQFGSRAGLLVSEGSLTILFLVFVGATTLYNLLRRRTPEPFDYLLMVFNAVTYFGVSYGLMWADLRAWMGGFSLLLALFYGGLSYLALRRGAGTTTLGFFALGIALVFLTIAIPVQLGDRAWTTIGWATEGTVLMWFAIRLRISQFRYYSYAVFAVTAIRLLFFDTMLPFRNYQPVVNERVLAFVFAIAAMHLTSYLLWKEKETVPGANASRYTYPVFLVAANLFSLWLVGAEIISYQFSPNPHQGSLPLIFLIAVAGAMTLYHLAWRRPSAVLDIVLTSVNAAFFLGISAPLWGDFRAWMGSFYLVLALFYGRLAYFALRRDTRSSPFGLLALGLALAFVTLAIPVQFGNHVWTTIGWAAEFVILMWLSFRLKLPLFRAFGYGVFVMMGLRLLFFDTAIDMRHFRPVLNERFLAFLVGIAATYLVVLLLRREKETMKDWAIPASTLLVAANFFTLWLFTFELWDYFASRLATTTLADARIALRNAQNLSLTALWTIYAVALLVIGIRGRWRSVRLWALGLLIIPIVKVFVYDVWALETIYRIVAFVGLGLLLLASAYLYQRYSKAIRGFIIKDSKSD